MAGQAALRVGEPGSDALRPLTSQAVADGLYGYWPQAPFDRIVAACSFRAVTPSLLAQVRPGGKILLTLSGWLYGYARVLLNVNGDGTAEGQMLGGTVSFMSARTHAEPAFGNPAHWAAGIPETWRAARHSPERITAATEKAFHLRFLAQCAASDAQMTTVGESCLWPTSGPARPPLGNSGPVIPPRPQG